MCNYGDQRRLAIMPPTTALQLRSDLWPETRKTIADRWPDVDAAIEQLIASRRSENTRIAYEADWRKWCEFVVENRVDIKIPGLAATTAFRDGKALAYGPASIARILSTLSFFYGALRDAGLVRTNPFAKVWLPRPEVSALQRTPAVQDDDVEKLLIQIDCDRTRDGRRDAAIVRLLYDTGLRRASLAGLRRDQFRRDGDNMVAIVILKGGREGMIRLTPEAEAALTAWLKIAPKSDYVFPKRGDPSEHVLLGTINGILTSRAKAAGITEAITPHRFRAAFITTAYDAKIYERDIQASVHHAKAETTRGYDRGSRGDGVYGTVAEFRKAAASEPVVVTTASTIGAFTELQNRALTIACPRCKAKSNARCRGPIIHRERILAAKS
jgi:integrase/recombinase XerD